MCDKKINADEFLRPDKATNKAVTGRPYRLKEAFHQSFEAISDDRYPGSPR
jgi:hypothetical protein